MASTQPLTRAWEGSLSSSRSRVAKSRSSALGSVLTPDSQAGARSRCRTDSGRTAYGPICRTTWEGGEVSDLHCAATLLVARHGDARAAVERLSRVMSEKAQPPMDAGVLSSFVEGRSGKGGGFGEPPHG